MWWFIWFVKNNVIFNDEGFSPRKVSFMVSSFFAQWKKKASGGGFEAATQTAVISTPKAKVVRAGPKLIWSPHL